MPQDVANVFRKDVFQNTCGCSDADAGKLLKQLKSSGRFVVEAWS